MLKQMEFLKNTLTLEEFNQIKSNASSLKMALTLYDEKYIDSVNVFAINNKRFIISKEDMPKLHQDWERTLGELSSNKSLINPVYVEVESNGVMMIE